MKELVINDENLKEEEMDRVITRVKAFIINSDKVVLTGKKLYQKKHYTYSGYIGGLKETGYDELLRTKSDLAVKEAVKGMLPKNTLGRQMIKKLRVYKDANHDHEAQKPEMIKLKGERA